MKTRLLCFAAMLAPNAISLLLLASCDCVPKGTHYVCDQWQTNLIYMPMGKSFMLMPMTQCVADHYEKDATP